MAAGPFIWPHCAHAYVLFFPSVTAAFVVFDPAPRLAKCFVSFFTGKTSLKMMMLEGKKQGKGTVRQVSS